MDRPVLRYFGGKFLLAPWIISHFPAHRVYVEPFGGAASVLMQKPRSYAEIYNDLDGRIVNVFRVLQNQETCAKLEGLLRLTPFARQEFELSSVVSDDPIEDARRTIIRSFMGFGADSVCVPDRAAGFRSNSNRSGTTPAHDWVNYNLVVGDFCERLTGVVIENKKASEVISAFDGPDTLFYVDPPYVLDTRKRRSAYRFEMSDADHSVLLAQLQSLKGMVILSGYAHSSYDDLGWKRFDRRSFADGANERVESLWLNPAAEKANPQPSLFGEVAQL
jgi:DNA adenine methylase